MKEKPGLYEARSLLLDRVTPVDTENVPLERAYGRIMAGELRAMEPVPPFDRSAYDGYALRAEDTLKAPVTLSILEEIPAGASPTMAVTPGTAAKILTGAPIPPGADCVVMYEKTRFTDCTVTLLSPVARGADIIRTGEDIQKGELLAPDGTCIGPGLAGSLAAQGIMEPRVYRRPRVAVISTGSELEEMGGPGPGKIRNSNRYMLEAALLRQGCEPVYMGTAGDSTAEIAALMEEGLACCDGVISTGGVSAGDYDLTPDAMLRSGVDILFHGVGFKPGMACAYGFREKKPVCALSGNPAASMTNFCALTLPLIKKLTGRRDYIPRETQLVLTDGFPKKSRCTRLLRGRLELREGRAYMVLPENQANGALSSTINCDVMAIVPAGSDAVPCGAVLKGFLL